MNPHIQAIIDLAYEVVRQEQEISQLKIQLTQASQSVEPASVYVQRLQRELALAWNQVVDLGDRLAQAKDAIAIKDKKLNDLEDGMRIESDRMNEIGKQLDEARQGWEDRQNEAIDLATDRERLKSENERLTACLDARVDELAGSQAFVALYQERCAQLRRVQERCAQLEKDQDVPF